MTREGPGAVIGRYKLLQQIGEGGFGVVYQAEQTEPVRRTVALKIVKLGMDTKQLVARFEAERQALALMDHPNIAKVLDAGTTEGGRPYFVMELVRGVPVTEYCDQARLDTAARLALFQQVCRAVQHAHQKGIIHRDLKPSNVLVAIHDGKPLSKVIDFGIAKATDRHLTEKTLFTEFRQMIGTPEYMAPEQAEMSGLDVDTRADVYSLGVLLYELLTGTTPFDMKALARNGYDAIFRTIREVDPQRPSMRVSTMGEELEAVASRRHTAGKTLGRELRGDLDWIVMKALEKDRSRRYETANAMALDIQRHLEHEPVAACPPSAAYRARKYARRHRLGVAAASIVLATVVSGVALSFARYADAAERRGRARDLHAAAARDEAAAEQAHAGEAGQRALAEAREKEAATDANRAKTVVDLVQDMLGSADPHDVRGRDYTVRQLLDDFDRGLGTRLKGDPEVEATVRLTMGSAYRNLGLLDKAEPHFRKALEISRRPGADAATLAASLNAWAVLRQDRGDYDEAERLHLEALAIRRKALGDAHPDVATSLSNLAAGLDAKGAYDKAEGLHREALAIRRKALGDAHPHVATSLSNLAAVLHDKGAYDEAEGLHREALAIWRKTLGDAHPDVATSLGSLAVVLSTKGAYDEAERLHREALAILRKSLGDEHPVVATSVGNLAEVLRAKGAYDEAEGLNREALAIRRKALGDEHPDVALSLSNLAAVLHAKEASDEAERLQREALAIWRKTLGDAHPDVGLSLSNLAEVLRAKGAYDEAERLHREALAIRRKALVDEHPDVATSLSNLALVLEAKEAHEESERLHREALAIRRKTLGDAHPDVATSLSNLAAVLHAKGAYDEAEGLHREALAIRRKALGDAHPHVALSLHNLAEVLRAKGAYDEAEGLHREALAICRKTLGDEHPNVATCLNTLAAVLEAKGAYDEAESLHREALAIRRKALGDEHPDVATILNNLAAVLHAKGAYDEAERLYREALAIRRKALGDEHPDVAEGRSNLLQLRLAKEDFVGAEAVGRELLARGRSHSTLAIVGMCLLKQAKWEEAEPILRECLAIRERELPDDWLRWNTASMLGEALCGQGKHAEAEPLLTEGYEKLRPPDPLLFRKREALERIVKLYEEWGKPDEAAAWRARLSE